MRLHYNVTWKSGVSLAVHDPTRATDKDDRNILTVRSKEYETVFKTSRQQTKVFLVPPLGKRYNYSTTMTYEQTKPMQHSTQRDTALHVVLRALRVVLLCPN